MLKGAVSLGVFGLSLFPAFVFLGLGAALGLGFFLSLWEGLEAAIGLPLRVRRVASSLSVVDLGVGGEPENMA